MSTICFVVWAPTAYWYSSQLIGFSSIVAFQSAIGFSFLATPFCYFIGFSRYLEISLKFLIFISATAIPRAMASSAVLLSFYSYLRIYHIENDIFSPFTTGALFMGKKRCFSCVIK